MLTIRPRYFPDVIKCLRRSGDAILPVVLRTQSIHNSCQNNSRTTLINGASDEPKCTIVDSSWLQRSPNNVHSSTSLEPGLGDMTFEKFEEFLYKPGQSIDNLLSFDVRNLPAVVRLSVLEAILHLSRNKVVQKLRTDEPSDMQSSYLDGGDWPQSYLHLEHHMRWSNWEFGITPARLNDSSDWIQSPKFELLVLMTVASANQLPVSRVLQLSGHLAYLWPYIDSNALSVAYSSLFRLLTHQLVDLALVDIFRLNTLVCTVRSLLNTESSEFARSSTKVMSPDNVNGSEQLSSELDLLTSAIRIQVLSKVSGLEASDAIALLRFIKEMGTRLNDDDQQRLLYYVDTSLCLKPQQLSLYTLVYICYCFSALGIHQKGVITRCLRQIQRKLDIAHRFPGSDQTSWLRAALAAMANLSTGAAIPLSDSVPLNNFSHPPLMPTKLTSVVIHPGFDLTSYISSTWARRLFSDVVKYIRSKSNGPHVDQVQEAELTYSLTLLGVPRNVINKLCTDREHSVDTSTSMYHPLIELLQSPSTAFPSTIDPTHIRLLPRFEWQQYYHLSSTTKPSTFSDTLDLHANYVTAKHQLVANAINGFQRNFKPDSTLNMSTFHYTRFDPLSRYYFSDILFTEPSTEKPDITKVVVCFVCAARDLIIHRPIDTLLRVYRDELKCLKIPVLMLTGFDERSCSCFLKRVQQALTVQPGIRSSHMHVCDHPESISSLT